MTFISARFALVFLMLSFSLTLFSQVDSNGNPVFNSISTAEESVEDYQLTSNYYTLRNNIENKGSSVFISEKPTLDDIESAALKLPSDFFIISRNQTILQLILYQTDSQQFLVINPENGMQKQYPAQLKGDITENRAKELVMAGYDPEAMVLGSTLSFRNKKFKIVSSKRIREAIIGLIADEKLDSVISGSGKLLSKDEIKSLVIAETQPGGKMDFFTEIKDHEYDGVQIKPGIFTTKLGVALYKWGRAAFDLGVNTIADALDFWKEIKGREANAREIDYITKGFNRELER